MVSLADSKLHGRTAARDQFIHELPNRMLMLAAAWEDFARKSDEEVGFLEDLASVSIVADTLKDLCKNKNLPDVSALLNDVETGLNNLPDSPIIGAGLFVDEDAGAATATGHGEEVIRIAGSHLVVELMRQGRSPEAACKEAIERVYKRQKHRINEIQVGFIAISKEGEYGAYCIHKGFTYAVYSNTENKLYNGNFLID